MVIAFRNVLMSMIIPSHLMVKRSVHLTSIGENTHQFGLTTTQERYNNIKRFFLILRVRFIWMIRIRISYSRLVGSQRIKGTEESMLAKDSSVHLMYRDASDLRSQNLIWIIQQERTQRILPVQHNTRFLLSVFVLGNYVEKRVLKVVESLSGHGLATQGDQASFLWEKVCGKAFRIVR